MRGPGRMPRRGKRRLCPCWPRGAITLLIRESNVGAGVRVVVWTDGYVGAEGAGWGFLARRGDETVAERGPLPACTSHEAEWTAALRALAWALDALEEGDELELRTDSALVAKGLASRRPEMSGAAGEMRARARQTLAALAERGVRSRVVRVARTENLEADGLAREGAAQR